jgi:hypothetical protein
MSVFSRRATMFGAAAAMTLPMAAGTANAAELAADADSVVTDRGRLVAEGTIRVPGEEIGGSADATTDGGSVTFDTPIGNGSTEVEGESFDVLVD